MKNKLPYILFFGLLFAFWQFCYYFKLVSPALLPSPVEVLTAFPTLFTEFHRDTLSTIGRSFLAFLMSLPIGIFLGYSVFYSKYFRGASELLLDFIRSIPATALIPIFIIIFGIDDTTKVAVGTFSSSLIIALSTILGLKNRNITRLQISEISEFSYINRFLLIDLPESSSHIFVGLRAGVSLALILVVVSEMFIGSNFGLGKVINDMRYSDAIPKLYAALLMTGIIGYFYNFALIKLESKLIHWKGYN